MSDGRPTAVIGLGEILWDLLPEGRKLGGAPANFAFHAAQLGHEGIAASRVGADEPGAEILRRLTALNLPTSAIQRDSVHPTGVVEVTLDADGQPSYRIVEDVAWDHMEWDAAWQELAGRAKAVCFGSLAQRSPVSRRAVRSFIAAVPPGAVRVFDINLRQHYYDAETLGEGMRVADIIKLNDEELPKVAALAGLGAGSELDLARALIDRFNAKLVCVTRGAKGSLLATPGQTHEHPGCRVAVRDTIGAGDAFLAGLVHHHLEGSSLERMNEAANRMGAYVASQEGATPELPDSVLAEVR